MTSNMKNGRLKSLKTKIFKSSVKCCSQLFPWLVVLEIPENFQWKVSAPETCILVIYRIHHVASSMQISKNFKKASPQSHKKAWRKRKIWDKKIVWFMILNTIYESILKKLFWKIYVLKKASADELRSGIGKFSEISIEWSPLFDNRM